MTTLVVLLVLVAASPVLAQKEASSFRFWAAQNAHSSLVVSWEAVPGVKGYRLYGAEGKLEPKLIGTAAPTRLFWVVNFPAGSTGKQRQFFLEPLLADGSVGERIASNVVVIGTAVQQPVPPASVRAEATGDSVVVTWAPVTGATAYTIGHVVAPAGLRMICHYCPTTEARYVERTPTLGVATTYAVAAVFPSGTSKRTMSNTVTPGVVATKDATGDTTTTTSTPQPTGMLGGILGGLTGTDRQLASVHAAASSGTSVRVTWTPPKSKTNWVKTYVVMRRIVGKTAYENVGTTNGNVLEIDDRFFPSTLFASGPITVAYSVYPLGDGERYTRGLLGTTSNEVQVTGASTSGGVSGASGKACTLEYRRADNMWAARGRADGNLGTETLALQSGKNRVFTTDWAYEKQRNDGNSYFGSHLRVARNAASGVLRLHLRTADLAGLKVFMQTGTNTSWIRLDPGQSVDLQADLMEVFCE